MTFERAIRRGLQKALGTFYPTQAERRAAWKRQDDTPCPTGEPDMRIIHKITTLNFDEDTDMTEEKKNRGFASMDPAKVKEIASKGGKAAHAAGTAHQFTSEKAREAGRKGGSAPHVRRGRGPVKDAPV